MAMNGYVGIFFHDGEPIGDLGQTVAYIKRNGLASDLVRYWLWDCCDQESVYALLYEGRFEGLTLDDLVEDALSCVAEYDFGDG